MNRLDKELEEALDSSEPSPDEPADAGADKAYAAPVQSGASGKSPIDRSNARRGWILLGGLLVLAGGILGLVFSSVEGNAIYSRGVDVLVKEHAAAATAKERERLQTRQTRVEGVLVKGSLSHRQDPCEYRFKLEQNGSTIDVHYPQCSVPDTFRDVPNVDVQVTAEGTLSEAGTFDASRIMAKCPSKYEMEQRAASGETVPHSLNPESWEN
jgi:cytochrome c-type biogenesis protein CcmE